MQPFGQPLANGTVLEKRYQILGLLGQGGMSRVYLAQDMRLKMRAALKENLQTSADSARQFAQEAEILAHLDHANLPRVTDHFVDTRTRLQYLVMGYIEGEDLGAMLNRIGPLPEQTALNWIHQILSALEYLHAQNPPVIHRDIKPSNIKITPQGKAMLVDFGIAKLYDPRFSTLTGARAVTPGYAAPEQYGMRTNERSDIYSLGATLYTMLTGRMPPEAPLLVSGVEKLVPPRRVTPSISINSEAAILRAMEIETTRRWQTVAQLRGALAGRETIPAPEPPHPIILRPNWIVLIGALAALVVVIALTIVVVSNNINSASTLPTNAAVALPTATQVDVQTIIQALAPTVAFPSATRLPTQTATPSFASTTIANAKQTLGIGSTKISPIDSATMMYVPAGEFLMGSNNGRDDEMPAHMVYLDAFWIDKYEVTKGLYKKCVVAGKCFPPPEGNSITRSMYFGDSHYDNFPVIYVSWDDANFFCI